MYFLRSLFAAALVAAPFLPSQAVSLAAAETAEQQYLGMASQSSVAVDPLAGQMLDLDVDLGGGSNLEVMVEGRGIGLRYRMAFNQVAEGWSWRPLADPAVEDYYRYHYLPLQSKAISEGEYEHEDKIGSPQRIQRQWRYDYFLAFDNLYDFYPRGGDGPAGFVASLTVESPGQVGMRARAILVEPILKESTTFWKATHGRPVDFTLKKRYFIGRLTEIRFVNLATGEVLCRIQPGKSDCGGE